jgi:hypothetical protein
MLMKICGLERRCGTGVEFFQGSAALFVGQAVRVVQFLVGLLFRLPRRLPFLASLRGSRGGGGLVLITGKGTKGQRREHGHFP